MDNHYELAILGGGCAGLSLAMRLAESGLAAPKTLILEKNAQYLNDRTWCFWDEGNPELKAWVDHSWLNFEIKNGTNRFTKSCANNPYLMLSAKTFYNQAIAKIALNEQSLTLLKNQEILEVTKIQHQLWRIITHNGAYTANKIVDTRPNFNNQQASSILWQSFIGDEVETSADVFDRNAFVLMDFDASFSQGLGFVYVLPFSARHALLEYTVFSENALTAEKLREYGKPAFLKYLNGIDYKTLRTEFGQLPMGNQKIKKSSDPSYVYAGLFAGAARPSSGYAFQRIQQWAKQCSDALINHQLLVAPKKDAWTLAAMDEIFLSVLKSNPSKSIALFFNFFLHGKTTSVIRFLSDHARIVDYFSIISAMPSLLFLKQLPIYAYKRLLNRPND